MKKLRLEKKNTFPEEKIFKPTFSHFVKFDSLQFAIAKGPQDLLNNFVQLKRTFFKNIWGQGKAF